MDRRDSSVSHQQRLKSISELQRLEFKEAFQEFDKVNKWDMGDDTGAAAVYVTERRTRRRGKPTCQILPRSHGKKKRDISTAIP